MRIIITAALLTAIFPAAAFAQAACNQLQIVNTIQMTRGPGGRDLVPVSLNGTTKQFVLQTGGLTAINQHVADELKLDTHDSRIRMFSAAGQMSNRYAVVHDFIAGHMHGADVAMQIMPADEKPDGDFGMDHWNRLDVDVDFGTDKMNMFSPDHCPGRVQYWTAPALAVLPVDLKRDQNIWVTVQLDGHDEQAIIDTGESRSTIRLKEAQRVFNLSYGSDDTPQTGTLGGDDTLKIYKHVFKTIGFGDVAVNNPEMMIEPDVYQRATDPSALVSSRAKSEKDLLNIPDMVIGMDVLRKLHIYMAFGEAKLYVTDASAQAAAAR
jgi:predicted aspartyl protease